MNGSELAINFFPPLFYTFEKEAAAAKPPSIILVARVCCSSGKELACSYYLVCTFGYPTRPKILVSIESLFKKSVVFSIDYIFTAKFFILFLFYHFTPHLIRYKNSVFLKLKSPLMYKIATNISSGKY